VGRVSLGLGSVLLSCFHWIPFSSKVGFFDSSVAPKTPFLVVLGPRRSNCPELNGALNAGSPPESEGKGSFFGSCARVAAVRLSPQWQHLLVRGFGIRVDESTSPVGQLLLFALSDSAHFPSDKL